MNIQVNDFPTALSYLKTGSPNEYEIVAQTFNELLVTNQEGEFVPLVASNLPELHETDSGVVIQYDINPLAQWDDGTSIKVEDIIFSLKTYKLPIDENIDYRTYYKRLINVIKDSKNPRRFSIVAKGNKNDILILTSDFGILRKSKFDPNNLLRNISLSDINNKPEEVSNDERVIQFYKQITNHNFKFSGEFFNASGPFKIQSIDDGRRVTLVKNNKWWADKVDGLSRKKRIPVVNYYIIPETISAIQALKNGELDIMTRIPTHEFYTLNQDSSFTKKFNLFSQVNFTFWFVGINSRRPFLNNKRIRKSLAHLINKEEIAKALERGYTESTIGPVNPILKYYYNDTIKPYAYDLVTSKKLLKESNEMRNRSGGPIELDLIYKNDPRYEALAQIVKNEAEKIGVKINLAVYDSRTFNKKLLNHDFDLFIRTLTGTPYSFNFSPIFGLEAANVGGMNWTGFGNTESDSVINVINTAPDSLVRRDGLFALQQMLHDEATMLFLYFTKNNIAVNKKFTNLEISSFKPGYNIRTIELLEQ
ncbi:MAG: ABC transporter substrate-binding protein [Cyclobacteriaceae bacterium]